MFSSNRHSSYSYGRKKSQKIAKAFLFLAVIGVLVVLIYAFHKNRDSLKSIVNQPSKNQLIMEYWENQNYTQLITYCNSLLDENPGDFDALVFKGFASFYEGVMRVNIEEKLPLIDESVFSLRKAVLFNETRLHPEINYVLGRAYYHKGKYYLDLAVKYLEQSIAGGYEGKDTYEYLGLVYSELGNKEKSAENFEKALQLNQSDMLYSLLAQIYIDLGSLDIAEEYLVRSNNITTNQQTEEKNLFLLAQIYETGKDYIKAEECYQRVLQKNPQSVDAYYKIGVLYEMRGEREKARNEWRKALRIDPKHYGTLLKMYPSRR